MSFRVGFDDIDKKVFVQKNTFLHLNDNEEGDGNIENIHRNNRNKLNQQNETNFRKRRRAQIIRLSKVYSEIGKYEFGFTNRIIDFPIPNSGIYRIEAWGARGGSESKTTGPLGAYSRSYFKFEENDIIRILVGEKGWPGILTEQNWIHCGGGGGGTFIAKGNKPLCVAGAGGSEAHTKQIYIQPHACGQSTQLGGDAGSGLGELRKGGPENGNAGGGAGFEGNGIDGTDASYGKGGYSFLNDGLRQTAGTYGVNYGYGGFGGGGSRHGDCGWAPGGGGYSGGSTSNSDVNKQGGGGGSYFEGNYSNEASFAISGCNSSIPTNPDSNGNGYVIIQLFESTSNHFKNKITCTCYKGHFLWTIYSTLHIK